MTKKEFAVSLSVNELIYDIDNKAYLTGRSRKDVASIEAVASMQSSDAEEDRNQILRSVLNASSQLQLAVSDYVKQPEYTEGQSFSNDLKDTTRIQITFNVPSNFKFSNREVIANIAHKYIVNKTLAEWFIITNKADAAEYDAMATNNIEALRIALNQRVHPNRSTM
jgi:hypothetical protein